MPYSIDTSSGFIRVTFSGTLTNEDIHGVLREGMTMDGGRMRHANHLEDMRGVSAINLGLDELWSLTLSLRGLQLPGVSKTAILTGNPVQYGIARMFQAILAHPQIDLEIFSDEDEAQKWLLATD